MHLTSFVNLEFTNISTTRKVGLNIYRQHGQCSLQCLLLGRKTNKHKCGPMYKAVWWWIHGRFTLKRGTRPLGGRQVSRLYCYHLIIKQAKLQNHLIQCFSGGSWLGQDDTFGQNINWTLNLAELCPEYFSWSDSSEIQYLPLSVWL